MDIWQRMYKKAKEQYHPEEVSPFIYAHHVSSYVDFGTYVSSYTKRKSCHISGRIFALYSSFLTVFIIH